MIEPHGFLRFLQNRGISFFAGVPDSTLKAFCSAVTKGVSHTSHIVAANEGSAIALAAGHHLATGAMGCAYMQNSGLGNAANPLISLNAPDVYGIPVLMLIGWRGELLSGVQKKDEPQHTMQGRITLRMLDCLEVEYCVVGEDERDPEDIVGALIERGREQSRPVALVVRKGVFDGTSEETSQCSDDGLSREEALHAALSVLPDDAVIIATTGKASRELYEHRIASGLSPWRDFLTVGSMGHALQIAAGVALARPERKVVCVDGDGALIMHMGGLATSAGISNLVHLVMNNGAHESAGGFPSRGFAIDMPALALACGYATVARADDLGEIRDAIGRAIAGPGSAFIEIRIGTASRPDLSRPTGSLQEAKRSFMRQFADGFAK